MTIPVGGGRMDYTGNGNTDTYSYNFKIFNKNHLKVTKRDADDVETVLTVDTDYTVSGVGDAGGGSITLTAGNLTSGYHLTIREVVPIEQGTDLRNQGDEYREVQEDALDYSIKVSRQQQDEINRSFKLPETITGVSAELPVPEALKFFRWDSLATSLENISLANLATIAVGNTLKLVNNQLDISAATSGLLVTNGDDHNHSGGDGGQIAHTALSGIGTNTHAQLDTELAASVAHRANVSNPHSVDKTDVGLSAVTNDAQVKVTDIGTTVLAPTGDGSGLTGIVYTILNKTADYTITAANCNGLTEINNANDNGVIVYTLPAATAGLAVKIKCSYQAAGGVSNTITINRNAIPGTDTFTVGATTGLTALTTSTVGSVWELTCEVAGVWIASLRGVQPATIITMSANQSIASPAATLVVFDTEVIDNNNNYVNTASNYKSTPTIYGRYRLIGNFSSMSLIANSDTQIYIYKNGASVKEFDWGNNTASNNYMAPHFSYPFTAANATDYYQIYVSTSTGTLSTQAAGTVSASFDIERISD